MALLLLVLLLVLLRFATGAGASAEPPRSPATALFVLGDSTVGCAATASSILPLNLTTTATLPSSLSGGPCLFFPAARPPPGPPRGQDGPPFAAPISALNGTASEAARGVNFGGGGQLLFYGGGERGSSPSSVFRMGAVGQQVRLASETLQLLQLEAAAPGEWESAAVFVLSFGADAYARLLARGPAEADAAAPKHGRRGFARLLADRVSRAVSELYEAGVRRVAVMGVPPLGCAPRVMWERIPAHDGGCVEEANELIEAYNGRLAARLDGLRPQLAGADVVFCDVYKGMMEIISNPSTYGFEETREACCGLGPLRATVGCVSEEMACGTPERHVWWDLYSPTEAADALVANWSWTSSSDSGATSICGPISLQQLAGRPPPPAEV
ncbi:unnamed protein product [Miscanthus lutarioriparius]|uniref:GDSL esterase/lipase n=1 Tax=Miscanthus lutarioriparius TaxID=422564 RepID=A0A811QFX1_9POAL|nr:unnamed protein product [Miscanthus lutarioriparius]